MSERADGDWAAMKHGYIRFPLGFAMAIVFMVVTGLCAKWLFGPDGGPIADWYEIWSLFMGLGVIAALPLFHSPTRDWRSTATAAAMGLIAGIQALAGVAAAILILNHWFPAAPDSAAYRAIPIGFGVLIALPVILGTVLSFWRKKRAEVREHPVSQTSNPVL